MPTGTNTGAVYFEGNIEKKDTLVPFLRSCRLLFHCAGEKNDQSKMRDVNVRGTEQLLSLLRGSDVRYFCYISSAGVIGKTTNQWVDENSPCSPQNIYEKSKYAAEKLVLQGLPGCKTAVLRPTNVIDDNQPGALSLPMRGAFSDWLKVFVKGGECAHIVHAEDVAQAALYFISRQIDSPACFFVSCDHEQFNTFGGLWSLYKAIERGQFVEEIRPAVHLPLIIPHMVRRFWRGSGNYGNVRYSSEKLLSTGFSYPLGVEGAVRRLASLQCPVVS
jgi:nucleoside-diphosphate-sugar epimerase